MTNRLTRRNNDGSYSIPGIDMDELDDRVRTCINKLGGYENTELSPEEIETMKLYQNDIIDILTWG